MTEYGDIRRTREPSAEQTARQGYVTVEQFDAAGSASPVTDATPDSRAAIQSAIDYANMNEVDEVRFGKRYYAARRQSGAGLSLAQCFEQFKNLLHSTRTISLKSTQAQGTDIIRRDTDGAAMTYTDFDVTTDNWVWRGGAFIMDGPIGAAVNVSDHSLTVDAVRFDGGLTATYDHTFPANTTTGDGWDIFDKGFWQFNDRELGHMTFRNGAGCIGFNGELVYSSGNASTASRALRFVTIDDSCVFGESNGSCINGNGATLRVGETVGPRLYNAALSHEAFTGELGAWFKARIEDCTFGVLWGGGINLAGGNFTMFTEPTPGVYPYADIAITVTGGNKQRFSSALRGTIDATDTGVEFGNLAAMSECKNTELAVTLRIDGANGLGVEILAGGEGTDLTENLEIDLTLARTAAAAAAGRQFNNAIFTYGYVGAGNIVHLVATDGLAGANIVQAGAGNGSTEITVTGP